MSLTNLAFCCTRCSVLRLTLGHTVTVTPPCSSWTLCGTRVVSLVSLSVPFMQEDKLKNLNSCCIYTYCIKHIQLTDGLLFSDGYHIPANFTTILRSESCGERKKEREREWNKEGERERETKTEREREHRPISCGVNGCKWENVVIIFYFIQVAILFSTHQKLLQKYLQIFSKFIFIPTILSRLLPPPTPRVSRRPAGSFAPPTVSASPSFSRFQSDKVIEMF